jgi:hypothetical protein
VSPTGSALAGGDDRTLLWRPAGQAFRTIPRPPASASATITGLTMPADDRAWFVTNTGQVFEGRLAAGMWSWTQVALSDDGNSLAAGLYGTDEPLRAIAIAADGQWRREDSGTLNPLESVALAPDGGPGALIGGSDGLVLTRVDGGWETAQAPDRWSPTQASDSEWTASRTVGVSLAAGAAPGETEAWAVTQVPDDEPWHLNANGRQPQPVEVLHYANSSSDSLVNPGHRALPLPDVPKAQEGEVTFAALGKSDCPATSGCIEMTGGPGAAGEMVRAIARAAAGTGQAAPAFVLYSGDVNQEGAYRTEDNIALSDRRLADFLIDPLVQAGAPVFGAIGRNDLVIPGVTGATSSQLGAGATIDWRQGFAGMPYPWGPDAKRLPVSRDGWSFAPVADPLPDDPAVGGAHTHYAVDVERGGRAVARLVVLDTSAIRWGRRWRGCAASCAGPASTTRRRRAAPAGPMSRRSC